MAGVQQRDGLAALVDDWAAVEPAAPMLFYQDRPVGIGAIAAESRRVAGGLAALGIGPGDRVAVWLPNVPAWLVLLVACARLGAIAVALNTRFRSAEVADILGRSGAKCLALWPGFKEIDFAGILADAPAADLKALETVIAYDGGEETTAPVAGRRTLRYADLARHAPAAREAGDAASPVVIFTTSGTTKAPKFVLHAQASLTRHARAVAAAFEYDRPDTVILQSLPLCGTFGLTQALAALAARRPAAMQRVFDAADAARLVNRHRVTTFNASDEMLLRLYAAVEGTVPFPSLRWVGFAAFSTAGGELAARLEPRGLTLAGLWGASELQALYARQRLDAPVDSRTACGGFPVSPAARVRVRDPESGRLLPPGEAGELELAGPSRMLEYFGDPGATAAAITEDGHVRMGDLGYLRSDGSFVFLARMGDVLRLGGYLVAPAEIEDRLQAHPSVAGAQVVAVPTATGPRPVAFVVPAPGASFDQAALQAHCVAALARYKVPVCVIPLAAFPVTSSANGEKIQRVKLREMALAALASSG